MKPQTVIFMGPSGSGKGTQAKLLTQFLEEHDADRKVFTLEVGKGFRELITQDHYTAQLEKAVMESGVRAPALLAVYLTAKQMIADVTDENMHFVIDGTSRSLPEAMIVADAMEFYKRESITVLFFDVSREWATERMTERGRADDTPEDIAKRLDWYEADVIPSMNYFREHEKVNVIDINGEQSVEEVHHEILTKLGLQ